MASSTTTTYTVIAEFTGPSGPENSLSPICTVTLADGTPVSSGAMTFISLGRYRYSFSGTVGTQYLWYADSITLPASIRYVGNSFKENVVSSTDIRDALLEDPDASIAPGRESIDNKIRRLELMVDKVMQFFNIPKNYRR